MAVFMIAVSMLVVPRMGMFVSEASVFDIVYGFGMLLAWTMFLVYSAYRIFDYYCLGNDVMLHISTMSRRKILAYRVIVLFGFTLTLALLTLICNASLVQYPVSLTVADGVYLVGSRVISLMSLFGLLLLLSLAAKGCGAKMSMSLVYGLSVVAIITSAVTIYWALWSQHGSEFFIGISDSYDHAPSYAFGLPFFDVGKVEFISNLSVMSTAANGIIAFLSIGVWWLMCAAPRRNFFKV